MNTRDKGTKYEREVAQAFEDAGFAVRGLESGGDHFAVDVEGETYHVEAKRHERLRLPEWLAQQERDCPRGVRRALVFRQSRRSSYVVVPLEQFLADTRAGARARELEATS